MTYSVACLELFRSWSVAVRASSVGGEVLSALVCARIVGIGKLPGTRNSLAQLRSMSCTRGDPSHWGSISVVSHKSHNATLYGMYSLPEFWGFIDSIAILTTDVSVFGPLSVADTLSVEAPLRNKVVILSKLGAHHTGLCVSRCQTSAGDPSSHLVRGFPATADMRTI
jgi:hypothetical protein